MVIFNESLEDYQNDINFYPTQMNPLGYKKKNKISKLLYKLSHYGINYSDDVYKNMQAIPADKHLMNKFDQMSLYGGYQDFFNKYQNGEEENAFHLKTLEEKRAILRRMAMQPELEEILDIVSNEAIVYDKDESYVCEPYIDQELLDDLLDAKNEEFNKSLVTNFKSIYTLLNWKKDAWNHFRKWLIDGVIAFEIVYDNIESPKLIIGIVEIDVATLTKVVKDGITTWVQYKGQTGKQRVLLDSQIIFVKYEDTGISTRQSYLERLIRPFNIYRIIEQAQTIWTVGQSSFKTVFTIPIGGMNRARGMQTLNAAMNRYKEDISFNTETGDLLVNGKMNIPFNKEYFVPENEVGSPKIETLTDGGPSLINNDQLKYHESKLYKISKVPASRFNTEDRASWFGTDPTQMLRDEINFSRFILRLLNDFCQIIVKPIQIQLALSLPNINGDKRILDAINVKFNSYNQFEELMEAALDERRAQAIMTISQSLMMNMPDGSQECYLAFGYLVRKYMNMSETDIEENDKYKIEDIMKKKKLQELINQNNSGQGQDNGMPGGMAGNGNMNMGMDNGLGAPPENPTGEPMGNELPQGMDQEMTGEVEQEGPQTMRNNQ